MPDGAIVQTAVQYLVSVEPGAAVDPLEIARLFHNPLIQTAVCISRAAWNDGTRPPSLYPHTVAASPAAVSRIELSGLSDGELTALSRQRLLALSLAEMQAVQRYFARADVRRERQARGLAEAATDVERPAPHTRRPPRGRRDRRGRRAVRPGPRPRSRG